MAYETIIVESRDGIGVVRLNRPAVLNALSTRVVAELAGALQAFDADRAIFRRRSSHRRHRGDRQ
jgi:enoyl-CoA hydratase